MSRQSVIPGNLHAIGRQDEYCRYPLADILASLFLQVTIKRSDST